jgi:PAS domain S-box-containing protein
MSTDRVLDPPSRRTRVSQLFRPGGMPPLFGDTAATLIVDDDVQLAEVLRRLLGREGYHCTLASSAHEARERLAECPFALALVDIMMPGESGLDLVTYMLGNHPDLAVVMVTGVDDPHIVDLALQSGVYGYVVKPFRPNQVLITVANAGQRRCLEMQHHAYEERLQLQMGEQGADLDDALWRLEEVGRERMLSAPNGEAKFRGLIETAPDAIVGVGANGRIEVVNAQTEHLFGYGRNELIGEPVEILVPDAARAVHPAHRSGYLADPTPRPMGAAMQLAGRRKDGTEFPAEISLSALATEEGLLVSAVVRDVTEQVDAVAERERFKAQAEHEHLESQLHQSHRLESLGQLAGGVAHDFNNLLGVIMNYASFVGEEVAAAIDTDPSRDWPAVLRDVDQIQLAAERAAQLTRQLLAFARREVVRPQVMIVNDVVRDLDRMLRRTIGEHVELDVTLSADLWPVLADKGQMEQVLVNLALNARDAMLRGGRLTIETANVDVDEAYVAGNVGAQAGHHVRLRVSDTGTGMDRDVRRRAFEPFFTTKPKGEGSGLGLATVYGIITQAGGSAHIYSEPGLGTTFSALFPATDQGREAPAESDELPTTGGGETVLVVEDEDAMRQVTERILARSGYLVLSAANGPAAIDLVGQYDGGIDLLVTDVVMPKMLGKDVAKRIVALRPSVRIMYMSGYALPVLGAQGTLDEGVTLLEKPFSRQSLLARVREVLDGPAPETGG